MADLDGLKIVNDRDGHAAGDLLIQKAGRALSNAMRAEDAIIRFGGDEFPVILIDTDALDVGLEATA